MLGYQGRFGRGQVQEPSEIHWASPLKSGPRTVKRAARDEAVGRRAPVFGQGMAARGRQLTISVWLRLEGELGPKSAVQRWSVNPL